MKENETELILRCNGQEHSWKGPWDADINDLLDAFYGLLVGATFSAKMVPEWMKEWAEDHLDNEVSIPDECDPACPQDEDEDDSEYGPDGRLKAEDGVNGHYADGTPVKEYQDEKAEVQARDDMDA